ncbi:nuclear transport factor 2 family protein [Sphingobium nicotianae]|uniref:Nuclear transport factor 2 family protein n=1 Tax=Sphingobium nicotianae TaxID=2782607 RepID=A0A9X1DC03_9SPHN|nr:nuclear transport factor 2 family protein [Sphingobium nicotianae]MBT2187352.1 nuclear transport factor 2 family protein [Sphingobium nicotianae]
MSTALPKAVQEAIDKIEIAELQSRYMYAIDWYDAQVYVDTFTEDGELVFPEGYAKGHDQIREMITRVGQFFGKLADASAPTKPAHLRHFVTNQVIRIDGDKAHAVAYWFDLNNDNQPRWPYLAGYGYYEDDLVRTPQGWRFSRRNVINEISSTSPPENPCW